MKERGPKGKKTCRWQIKNSCHKLIWVPHLFLSNRILVPLILQSQILFYSFSSHFLVREERGDRWIPVKREKVFVDEESDHQNNLFFFGIKWFHMLKRVNIICFCLPWKHIKKSNLSSRMFFRCISGFMLVFYIFLWPLINLTRFLRYFIGVWGKKLVFC